MDNLTLYNKVRSVPDDAKKPIQAGRLKGMTDINPMWRIKTLTEQFGPCGLGWYYDVTDKWTETAGDEVTANVQINLFVREGDAWSKPITGIGGSKLLAREKAGPYVSDECYKMALTDAISVACKALGMGADVYWQSDRTKYNTQPAGQTPPDTTGLTYRDKVIITAKERGISWMELAERYGLSKKTTEAEFAEVLRDMEGRK